MQCAVCGGGIVNFNKVYIGCANARNKGNRIELRIGINLGDVIVDGDDLYGDGVNIAARVEALADAGGVFVSNTVHHHVRDRLPFVFEDLGEQQVKNIARPVRDYRVREAGAATRSPEMVVGFPWVRRGRWSNFQGSPNFCRPPKFGSPV
jgi:hypothetical protein